MGYGGDGLDPQGTDFDYTEVRIPVLDTGDRFGGPANRRNQSGQQYMQLEKRNALSNFQFGYSNNDPNVGFLVNEMVRWGIIKENAAPMEVFSAYDKALKLTASMSLQPGNKDRTSVLEAFKLMQGSGLGGPAGPGGTYKDFIKYTPEQVSNLAESTYQAILGRVPTAEEVRAFGKALAAGAKATPAIRKVSSTGKVTINQKGFDEGAFIAGYMSDKIPDAGSDLDGAAGKIQDLIDGYRENYGVSPTQGFINNAIREVVRAGGSASGAIDNIEQQLKEQAQVLYPALKDKINDGLSVLAIADPYISKTARLLEKADMSIGLDNKYVSSALSRKNDKGEYELMSLDDHAKSIRSSAEWLETKNAKETFLGAADSILATFGFIGR
jgi:hypothetical protein